MIGRDFFDKVAAHDTLEWLGVRDGLPPTEDEVIVHCTKTGAKYALPVNSILQHSWNELEGVLTGRRVAHIMIQLTRIVGYYSRVQNWNGSKIAELKARHAGTYSVPSEQKSVTAADRAA